MLNFYVTIFANREKHNIGEDKLKLIKSKVRGSCELHIKENVKKS